jgi:hypothetical protein
MTGPPAEKTGGGLAVTFCLKRGDPGYKDAGPMAWGKRWFLLDPGIRMPLRNRCPEDVGIDRVQELVNDAGEIRL